MDTTELAARLEKIATELATLSRAISGSESKSPPMVEEKIAEGVCLNCGKPLGDKRVVRGNHESCYREIKNHIRDGAYTEDEAIAGGLLLPTSPGGRPGNETRAKQLASKIRIAEAKSDVADLEDQIKKGRTGRKKKE